MTACHCLCAVNHPEQSGLCAGDPAPAAITFEVSTATGTKYVRVTMCQDCRVATLAHRHPGCDLDPSEPT